MTFDDLLDWVEQGIGRLKKAGVPRERRRHLERLLDILEDAGEDELFAKDWIALAQKIALALKVPTPDVADLPRPSQKRRPSRSEPPAGARGFGGRRGGVSKQNRPVKRRRAVPPRREAIEMNPELEAAFAAVAAGRQIIFVTGGAGTGKSTFIRELRERFPKRNSIVLAPTGVAALNAGGQTIHSFCKLPLRAVSPEDIRKIDDPEVVQHLDLLIVDEVSMVRADILDGLEIFLRLNRDSKQSFGGVQVILVGDLFQLPPVVTASDAPFLASRYESAHFFSARCLKGLSFFPVELRVVYRQRDVGFAELLRSVRDGEKVAAALAEINRQCVGRQLAGRHLVLVPTRKAAAQENEQRLAALPGRERAYVAKVEGTFSTGSDDRLPAPSRLVLKRGTQVMFTRNDPEKRWVNGTVGIVERLSSDAVVVRVPSGELEVDTVEWQNLRYAWDETLGKIVEEVLGSFVQFPLMPAWAVTIHKAQGLTLAAVAVDLGHGAFAEGQVYVAMSRCQTIEGLSLTRPVRLNEVRCSEAARRFYEKMRRSPARA